MNNEEKLKRLLGVAVENGWESPLKTPFERCKVTPMNKTELAYKINPDIESYEMWCFIHLNDIVSNWEEGVISFIEALCKASYHNVQSYYFKYKEFRCREDEYIYFSNYDDLRKEWLKPTSKRLNWLFGTFKHLL